VRIYAAKCIHNFILSLHFRSLVITVVGELLEISDGTY